MIKVLVAEDDAILRIIMAAYLQGLAEYDMAADGFAAITFFEKAMDGEHAKPGEAKQRL